MSDPFQEKESKDRIMKFMKAYDELVAKYQVELMAYPMYVPSGQKGFNTTASMMPIDRKTQAVPSPLSDEKGIL